MLQTNNNHYFQIKPCLIFLIFIQLWLQQCSIVGDQMPSKEIEKLEFKITNENGEVIYPFNKLDHYLVQCGATKTLNFKERQIMFIECNQPFMVVVSSDEKSIRINGYAESIESESKGKHLGMLLVTRKCNSYFSFTNYETEVSLYIKNEKKDKYNSLIMEPLIIKVPSRTYCMRERELYSLEEVIDVGFFIVWATMVSLIPIFPINSLIGKIILITFIVLSQLTIEFESAIVTVLYICCILQLRDTNGDNINYELKAIKLLSRRSLASLFLFYIAANFMRSYAYPVYDSTPTLAYIVSVYTKNIMQNLIFCQVLSSVCWINRIRALFWWVFTSTIFYYFFLESFLTWQESNPTVLSLMMPSLFSQNCNYKSIFIIMVILPVCQFVDRFRRVKIFGLLVLISMILIGVYSQKLQFVVGILWVVGWIIFCVVKDGVHIAFTRRWLSFSEVVSLNER